MTKTISLLTLFIACAIPASAQHGHTPQRFISFPDVPGYQTLVCDLHIHTVFSDGSVWPNIRVQEALRDGLDCLAVTEHIEYAPHKDDIPHPDRNRSFEIASHAGRNDSLIILNGSEITRSMPPGHANAVFVSDANALVQDEALDAYQAASAQGAFTFWNHPNWTAQRADGVATLTDMHRELIKDGLLHGIEVANDRTYSDEALQIALDEDLTIIGASDIHGLIDWDFDVPHGGHRPVTLVFATERSEAAIREALFARRTAAWFQNTLIGRESDVMPLVEASITVTDARYPGDTSVLNVTIENRSDASYLLLNQSPFTFHQDADLVVLEPHSEKVLHVKTIDRVETLSLLFDVVNVVTAPATHPRLSVDVRVTPQSEK